MNKYMIIAGLALFSVWLIVVVAMVKVATMCVFGSLCS